METIASRIDAICRSKRLSYKELSGLLEITPQTIYQIMNGRIKNPSSMLITKFERIGINPSWLLTGDGVMLKEDVMQVVPQQGVQNIDYLLKQIEQKDSLIKTLQTIIDSQLLSLGKWLDVSCSRFVFFMPLKNKFRYINVMI